ANPRSQRTYRERGLGRNYASVNPGFFRRCGDAEAGICNFADTNLTAVQDIVVPPTRDEPAPPAIGPSDDLHSPPVWPQSDAMLLEWLDHQLASRWFGFCYQFSLSKNDTRTCPAWNTPLGESTFT